MNSVILDIDPRELKFIFELRKQSSCSVLLINKSNFPVAFKVKTTSPKKYCVRPNVGILKPKSACNFIVTMQAQRVAPPDMICKDKFLIQSTVVPEGTTDEDITSSMFCKDIGKHVEENKLKVVLVSPSQSPTLSPMNEVHKPMEYHEDSLQNDQAFNKIQFINSEKSNRIEDISPQKTGSIAETTLGNKSNGDDISNRNNETIEAITFPNNKSREDISFQNNETIKDITFPNNEHVEDINLQKNETVKYINMQSAEDVNLQKNNAIKDISIAKNNNIEDISLPNDNSSEDIILQKKVANSNNSEDISIENKMAKDAMESKKGTGAELVGTEYVEFGRLKAVQDHELVKDIDKMKSELKELELKLSEARVMISKLTEDRQLSTQQEESLRKELAMLKSKARTRRVQFGFPLYFVVMVALIAIALGYLLHC